MGRPIHTYHQVVAVQISGLDVLNSAIKAPHAEVHLARIGQQSTMDQVMDQDHSKHFLMDQVILEDLLLDHQILIFHPILQVVRDLLTDLDV
jgi:hypothetical protein